MFRREEVERFVAFFYFVMRTIANYREEKESLETEGFEASEDSKIEYGARISGEAVETEPRLGREKERMHVGA